MRPKRTKPRRRFRYEPFHLNPHKPGVIPREELIQIDSNRVPAHLCHVRGRKSVPLIGRERARTHARYLVRVVQQYFNTLLPNRGPEARQDPSRILFRNCLATITRGQGAPRDRNNEGSSGPGAVNFFTTGHETITAAKMIIPRFTAFLPRERRLGEGRAEAGEISVSVAERAGARARNTLVGPATFPTGALVST